MERRVFERRFNGLDPRPAKASTTLVEPIAVVPEPPRPAAAPRAPDRTAVIVGFALLTVLALAGAVVVGRRPGDGGVAGAKAPERPAAPSYADAALEAELHEMIAEARARSLLDGEPENAREPAAPR